MNTPPCSHRHDELTPGLVVRESLSVVSVELVLITACALMFSFISARENRQTTCPMPWTGDRPPIRTESFCATPRFSDILRTGPTAVVWALPGVFHSSSQGSCHA